MRLYWIVFLLCLPLFSNECKIILLRHGETEWNVTGKSQGWNDIPLNEKGRDQARDLSKEFAHLTIQTIYSSSLSRAVETAQIIAEPHKASVISDPAIRFYRQDKKRKQWFKTKKAKQAQMEREITDDAVAYFKTIAKNHPGETVLVVTHRTVVSSLIRVFGFPKKKNKKLGNGRVLGIIATESSFALKDYDLLLE